MMTTVLCYGDSNTFGEDPKTRTRYPYEVRWTGRLQKLLGEDYRVIEEGCGGRTTVYEDPYEFGKNGLMYLMPCLDSHIPVDIVILMLGTNDVKDVYRAGAELVASNAGSMAAMIKTHLAQKQGFEPEVILVSPPEIGERITETFLSAWYSKDSAEKSREFPEFFERTAKDENCVFIDAAKYVKPSTTDWLHLDPGGHAVLAETFAETIKKLTKK